jgi:hypothetical protein
VRMAIKSPSGQATKFRTLRRSRWVTKSRWPTTSRST